MKKDYASYLYLRNKSSWGWDTIYNRPIPPSDDAWFELADRYRKYRNKSFLYLGDIQRFLSKDIATGVHANSSRPARDKQSMGPSSSRLASRQRELNFDENLDECMPYQPEDVDNIEEMTPTPRLGREHLGTEQEVVRSPRAEGCCPKQGKSCLRSF